MNDFLRVGLQNFLYNAGILGFIAVLDKGKCSHYYEIKGSDLYIGKALFLDDNIDLAVMYYEALRERFQDGTVYQRIVNMNDQLKNSSIDDDSLEKLMQELKTYLQNKRYKSGFEIAKQKGVQYNPLEGLKAINEMENDDEKIKMAIEITDYILKFPEIFCFKDIAEIKVSKIWNNISFLLPHYKIKDMIDTHRNVFIKPLKNWISKSYKAKDYCIECGISLPTSLSKGLSWLNDMGVDHKRKYSYFWNFKPDSYLCPLCAFIYSCTPLGFSYSDYNDECVFINNSESIEALQRDNISAKSDIDHEAEKENIGRLTYRLINRIINEQLRQKQKYELSNIQVIIKRRDGHYDINLLSRTHLKVIKECGKELERLTKAYLTISNKKKSKRNSNKNSKKDSSKDRLYVFQECIRNLINGYYQYGIINMALRKGFSDGENVGYVRQLLKVQLVSKKYIKGGSAMVSDGMLFAVSQDGIRLRKKFENKDKSDTKKDSADNKLRGFAYQLLNALQVGDCNGFLNIVSRIYIGMGEPIPNLFMKMLNNEEAFKSLGYAYVLGLKGTAEEYSADKQKNSYSDENSKEVK
ncbi:CRISPR-associated protein [Pelotomaculum schinkii]|uniref:CRISPR-associated protein n=1 Tax=Pelotomaculum schinkii TaxID=78350 RepID=A0A4Y7RBA0_9FIRM|nr:type I-B CRISPR-associated protein Cas8b1/Cst1 [Pelotomaculum schinkii]TEB05981.1 CRISPR-associated protein [Pelotomaculum schinkii]